MYNQAETGKNTDKAIKKPSNPNPNTSKKPG